MTRPDSTSLPPDAPREDPEDRKDRLFAHYVDLFNSGAPIDYEEILAEHPDIGRELVDDLRAFLHIEKPAPLPTTLGDYRILKRIGSGGMGVVYEAWEVSMDRRVALKVLPPAVAADTRLVTRFVREAKLAGKLSHPNVVPVYAMGLAGDTPYYSMEFVEGETLAGRIARSKAAPAERRSLAPEADRAEEAARPDAHPDAVDLRHYADLALAFAGAADGLQHAHGKGIVHRDIKPSNLIIDREGRLRVLDFGLARFEGQDSLTMSGDMLGTVMYMSPEQAMARRIPLDHRTDIYSLGATLYEALALRPPFLGKTAQETLSQIVLRDPAPLRALNPRIPRDLETIAAKCLRKDPADRYGTAEAAAQDLRRFARGDPIEARPQSRWEKLAGRARRHKVLIAAAAVFLALAIAGVAGGIALLWREQVRTSNALNEVLRLSDVKRLAACTAEAEALWPCVPEKAGAMEAWLETAGALAGRLDEHRRALDVLRAQTASGGSDTETEWRRDVLDELVRDLEAFIDPASGLVAGVRARLEFARTIVRRSIEERAEDWDRAIASIANRNECPRYAGFVMKPQLGLVPIGRDPASGLWEFAHVQTGKIPARKSDGALVLTERSGLVFVLIPGGTFTMGAVPGAPGPNVDPLAGEAEGPVNEVALEPFFLSKYEMTQGQWLRFTGENPSIHGPGLEFGGKRHSLLHPVEQVSWDRCSQVLGRLGFVLPTEAQWEYAARAGTTSAWWTGNERESLRGAANLSDSFCHDNGASPDWPYEEWLDDGYVIHAPAGSYRANAFGLHDTAGNVYEWCRDRYCAYTNPARPGDGERSAPDSKLRPIRGGCWNFDALYARSAWRVGGPPETLTRDLGVRPAREITR